MTATAKRHCAYFMRAWEDPARMAEAFRLTMLPETLDRVDTLIGRGMSGAIVVPGLARELGLRWAIVRKESDDAHDWGDWFGDIGANWLFVDDFIDTGATLAATRETVGFIADREQIETTFCGTFEYERAIWPAK